MALNESAKGRDNELRDAVGHAIQEWLQHRNDEDIDTPNGAVFLSGWAAVLEYETRGLAEEECSGVVVLVPAHQAVTMTRGLYERGAEVF